MHDFKKRRCGEHPFHRVSLNSPDYPVDRAGIRTRLMAKPMIFTLHYTASPWTLSIFYDLTAINQNGLPSLRSCLPPGMPNCSKLPVCAAQCLIHRQNGLVILFLFGCDLSTQNQEDNNVTVGVGEREYKFIMGHAHSIIILNIELFHLILLM